MDEWMSPSTYDMHEARIRSVKHVGQNGGRMGERKGQDQGHVHRSLHAAAYVGLHACRKVLHELADDAHGSHQQMQLRQQT